jgi:hypothetical protein
MKNMKSDFIVKIPLYPPLGKGDLTLSPFRKGGLNPIPLLGKGDLTLFPF